MKLEMEEFLFYPIKHPNVLKTEQKFSWHLQKVFIIK